MNFEEELQKIKTVRDYEISKVELKTTLKLIALRNQDIDELMKKLDAIRAGEGLETPLRDVIENILDDLDELDDLMIKKKKFECKIEDFGFEEKAETKE